MRIVHFSDWHLGAGLGELSRLEEHRLFSAWLIDYVRSNAVDVLLLAGDVFHTANPPAEAQSEYYRVLAQLSTIAGLQVVVIGGNHDSPSRLDAPREVLSALNVTVVGGWESGDASRFAHIVCDHTGAPQLGVAAIPFVHEYRLGVRLNQDDALIVTDLRARYAQLYTQAADAIVARAPRIPMVAMGHMTIHSAELRDADWGEPTHQVGGVFGLDAGIFDARFAYVALGHIHRCYPVDDARRVWYSGSPVGIRDQELTQARYVLRIDLDDTGPAQVERIAVPRFRRIELLRGEFSDVVAKLQDATRGPEPLAPWAMVEVVTHEPIPDFAGRLESARARGAYAAIPSSKQLSPARVVDGPSDEARASVELTPRAVFGWAWAQRYGAPPDPETLARLEQLLVEG